MTTTGVQSVYSGRSTNWPMIWLTTALAVALIAMGMTSEGSFWAAGFIIPVGIVMVTLFVNMVTATSVRTTAGPNGVTVHFGTFGWPRFHYPIARIVEASAIDVPSSQWVWGMYWAPRRGLMLTLRTGPALRLTLTNGRSVTISTPGPDAAVRAIDAARP
jgi:hypothetical protein